MKLLAIFLTGFCLGFGIIIAVDIATKSMFLNPDDWTCIQYDTHSVKIDTHEFLTYEVCQIIQRQPCQHLSCIEAYLREPKLKHSTRPAVRQQLSTPTQCPTRQL
jgi:hypothetical protein